MTHLDLFSGAGGFSLGLKQAGFPITKTYFSEIDKHAVANYKYNFKDAEYIGSVKDIRGRDLGTIDIITFGSPCQDFSLAGKRKGLEGDRSSLVAEAIRLIEECQPRFFIWENVKGTFSSNAGADFWGIIQAFTNLRAYRLSWQLLNTVWLIPQNRERIYLVGLTGTGSGGEVFPLPENNRGVDARTEQTQNAGCLTAGGNSGGLHSSMTLIRHRSDQPFKQGNIAPALRNGDKREVRIVDTATNQAVIEAMRGRNPDNPSDRTTGSPTEQRLEVNQNGTTNTLTSVQKDNLVILGYTRDVIGKVVSRNEKDTANTLHGSSGQGGNTDQYVKNEARIRRLTPIECERLQGFPDSWTAFGDYDGEVKTISDTQRYRLMGNAVTKDVVVAVAKQIKQAL